MEYLFKLKKLLPSFIIMLLFSNTIYSQSFFKTLPKFKDKTASDARMVVTPTKVTSTDSSYGALRPIYVAAAYSLPDRHLMAGVGFGYQNITYNYLTERSYCNFSINAVGFGGGAIAPTNVGQVVSYGLLLGAVNNTVMAGAALNSGKVNFVVSIGINFNN